MSEWWFNANDEPYAQKTDLGWGIVGIVDPTQVDECDAIGVSHRVLTCEVPQPLSVTAKEGYPNHILFHCRQASKK